MINFNLSYNVKEAWASIKFKLDKLSQVIKKLLRKIEIKNEINLLLFNTVSNNKVLETIINN